MNFLKYASLILFCVFLSACAKDTDEDDLNPYKGMSAKELFRDAEKSLKKKQYQTAVKQFEALESMYPFSDDAERAGLDLVYACYQSEDYPSSAATAERFIRLYPRSPYIDYAWYMKSMANFHQLRGALVNRLPFDESWRDPGSELEAYNDFSTLVSNYPKSQYRADALQHMIYLRNLFARRELHNAEYYFKRKMYVAARERAQETIKNYPQSPEAKDALLLVYRANKAMGLAHAAEETLKVYRTTYGPIPRTV